jgi:3',5'-cyclic AMP phosphodiesterase CpdA
MVRLARDVSPDVVVISGDLTQRAKMREYRTAAELIGRLPRVPVVVTPGNHDVPLWRVWERALTPYRNWRRTFGAALDTVTRAPGATFVALNSSAPRRTLVSGRLAWGQLDFARRAFAASPDGDVRALVVHHHFVPTPDGGGGRPLPRALELVRAIEEMEVDFVLGGHVHQTHVRTSSDLTGAATVGVPLIACGTTASRRGRGPEADLNSLNIVRVGPLDIEVCPHILVRGASAFEPAEPFVFARSRNMRTGAASARSAP